MLNLLSLTFKTKRSWSTVGGPYEEFLIEELGIFINMPKCSLRPAIQRLIALLTSGET